MNWPNLNPVLAPLHWAVWGGVALRHYLPEHTPSDLDVAVAAADSAAADEKMMVAGYVYAGQSEWGEAQWRDQSGTVIDITLGEEEWWPQALAEAQTNRDALGFPILPIPYQILLKLDDPRPKIAAQIVRLLAIADPPTLAEVRRLVARYRPQKVGVVEGMMEAPLHRDLAKPSGVTARGQTQSAPTILLAGLLISHAVYPHIIYLMDQHRLRVTSQHQRVNYAAA